MSLAFTSNFSFYIKEYFPKIRNKFSKKQEAKRKNIHFFAKKANNNSK